MNKKVLLDYVKNTRLIYLMYFYIGTAILRLLRIFIKPISNNILFVSFGGKKYDDSPKAIFELMRSDIRFKNCNFYWGLANPKSVTIANCKIIKIDTLRYFMTALKCGCWITNSSVTRGLDFKPKKTFYLNTWHGTAIKKIENDTNKDSNMFESKSKEGIDIMLVQSQYDLNTMMGAFGLSKDKFSVIGYPRNDSLFKYENDSISNIKNKLGIPENKKVILYMPTFREYEMEYKQCYFKNPLDLNKWISEMGEMYVLLFRAHYEVRKLLGVLTNDFIIDVSDYYELNDLLIISDILVSDYSSVFFDYSLLHRPMICFAYDYLTYDHKRGLYFDIRNEITSCSTSDELINVIKTLDMGREIKKATSFQKRYVTHFGDSTVKCVDLIAESIL